MDTKALYLIAVAVAAVSGGYYYYSGKGQKLDADAAKNMTYTADGIQLTQTDEHGQLHVRAQVDHLEQNMQSKSSALNNVHAQMYKDGVVDTTFYAKRAFGENDNTKVLLKDQVLATKIMQQGEMQFKTTQLIAYPKQRELETDQQVEVVSPQANFISQGLKANLNEGQYEFFNIRGKYEP
jgi:lipopolysaccharide export system protein LptC